MKKAVLSILFISFLVILGENVFASGCAPVSTQTSTPYRQTGVIRMNTMSPATFRYPASYTHATTRYISSNSINHPFVTPYGRTNVNIYVGAPVYVMRSGMVRIKHRPRKGRVGTLYPDIDYYEY